VKSFWEIRKDASDSILIVLIWSVFSLLATRLYLNLRGYPQIGSGEWHVSHAAIGGVIMIVGITTMLIFVHSKLKKLSLMMFGIGTGLFIDEIGKYLTRDYNYFFRPAIIFMYIFFVSLFLIYRNLRKYEKVKSNGKINAAVLRVSQISYKKVFRRKMVMVGLWAYSIYYAIDKILDIFRISTSTQKMMMIQKFYQDYDLFGKSDVYMIILKMIIDLISAVLLLIGARYFWSKKRLRGIRFFKYGIYSSILLGSIFRFYFEQFGGIMELMVGIIILEMLSQYRREIVAK
jgi:hypothetical protein